MHIAKVASVILFSAIVTTKEWAHTFLTKYTPYNTFSSQSDNTNNGHLLSYKYC